MHVVWAPQPGPQAAYVSCPIFDVCYGGARGGGKTDGSLGDWAIHSGDYGVNAKGIFVRRELPQLEAAIERSKQLYFPLGAKFLDHKKTWIMPGGGRLSFRPLEKDKDAEKYQGHDYTRVYPEELTNYPKPDPIDKMSATLRSAAGVPVGLRSTCNPGGPGHVCVKERYIDPAPRGYKLLEDEHGNQRMFIPAKLQDNPALLNADPRYAARLNLAGSAELVKAWLEGIWDIVDGAFFDNWHRDLHVLAPFTLPEEWPRFRSFDWGSASPFSVGWWAVVTEDFPVPGRVLPRGALVRYAEWYGASGPNKGLKMTAEQVAQGIVERELGMTVPVHMGYADPSIFAEDGGPSIDERMRAAVHVNGASYPGPLWTPADNKRVTRSGKNAGPVGGWDQMRGRLTGLLSEDLKPTGVPMIYCFATCKDSIRTIPALQHDLSRAEDVDTAMEDHAADEWRYACMSRPWVPVPTTNTPPPADRYSLSFGDVDASRVN
ncbi:MAG: terminase family protein [Pseudomonadota bacterium]